MHKIVRFLSKNFGCLSSNILCSTKFSSFKDLPVCARCLSAIKKYNIKDLQMTCIFITVNTQIAHARRGDVCAMSSFASGRCIF